MRSRLLGVLALGAALSVSSLVGGASASPQQRAPLALQELRLSTGARIVIGRAPKSDAASTPLRARAALTAFAPAASRLELAQVEITDFADGDRIVRFEQTHAGLPVIGRGAAVRLDAAGETRTTTIHLEEESLPSASPTLAPGAAAAAAQAKVGFAVKGADAHLAVLPTREGARLVYVFVVATPLSVPTAPIVMIDAHSGAVLEVRERVRHATAKVYASNPVKSPNLETKPLPMDPRATTDGVLKLENDFLISNNCVDKKEVKTLSFGAFSIPMHICSLDQMAVSDATGAFDLTPVDNLPGETTKIDSPSRVDAFSELSMYYHATRAYQFYRGLQGNDTAQVVADKPFRTISNLMIASGLLQGNVQKAADSSVPLDPISNAAFMRGADGGLGSIFKDLYGFDGGAMVFGQGPRKDYSYDGDVVYHEFTHAVVDNTLGLQSMHLDKYGMFDAPGAMNEGLSDYFSSAITGDPDLGEYAMKDIDPSQKFMRTLNNDDSCPKTITGEVHFDSTLFSGGLWKARASLATDAARTKFDAAIYKAMRNNPRSANPGYEDVVQMFLAVLKTDLPEGATALEAEMTKRGVLPGCSRIFTFTGAAIKSPVDSLGRQLGFAGYGKSVQGATLTPGMLQVKMDLPANTGKVTVKFAAQARQQGGGALGFGSQGTPFKPVVLAKFGKFVEWTMKGKLAHDADVTAEAKASGAEYAATFDAPDGATSVYVQIANSGDNEGSYDSISLTTEAKAPADPPAGETPKPAETTTTGCTCTTVPASGAPLGAAGVAALGALALVLRRRRG